MKTRFNWTNFKKHLTYNWWKYILAAVLIGFGTDILFTVTRYVVPDEKKVEVYVYGFVAEDSMKEYMAKVGQEEMPDMEEMSCQMIMPDDQYSDMVLQVRLMAGEGDVYIVPKDQFFSLSANGFLAGLDKNPEIMQLIEEKGLKVDTGWRSLEDQTEKHLFGIPVSQLPGLSNYVYAEDGYIGVYVGNSNDERIMKFLKRFLSDMSESAEDPQ